MRRSGRAVLTIGLISDTHGLLRPEAVASLRGSDFIIHAGDVGDPAILTALSEIAPVTAVRGNVDTAPWASGLPETARLTLGDIVILVIHDVAALDPAEAAVRAVIAGHSHRPGMREQDGVLFVNPGSAGRRRFRLPISMGRLHLAGDQLTAELVDLSGG